MSFTGKTQKECRNWIRETTKQVDAGIQLDAAKIKLEDFLNDWLISAQASLRPKSWYQYKFIVRSYIIPDLGKIRLVDLRPHHIQRLYDRKVKDGLGYRTIQLIHSVLHRALNHALKLGLLSRNPDDATTPPKPIPKEMKVLDEDHVQQLISAAQASNDRYLAIYQLAISTGMRQGELLGLKWTDVDWGRNTLQVERQLTRIPHVGYEFTPPKTKAGVRKIALGTEMLRMLREHQQRQQNEMISQGIRWSEDMLMFSTPKGDPIHLRALFREFKNLIKYAELPNIRFHDLRHTAASLMLNHGVPVLIVSRRLGHSKPSVTLDVYGHLIPSMQGQAAEVMDTYIAPIPFKQLHQTAPELHQH
ncbi:MAG: site-specific integrase [Chloroflexi bacterium]|nr:site-specific integrase [Chloroflexota bacterium]